MATRVEDIPEEARPFLSVDGSVPGAARTWDHHLTGEAINLDAMPGDIDLEGVRGVGTTLADTDALASVVAVLVGGEARLPAAVAAVLRAASYRCDHLRRAPDADEEVDAEGCGLDRWVATGLLERPGPVSRVFAELCAEVAGCVAGGRPLPFREATGSAAEDVAALGAEGRIRRLGDVAVIDMRGRTALPPETLHAAHAGRVAVIVHRHAAGGLRYTVGVNPFHPHPPTDLRPLLVRLAHAEHSAGPPCRGREPAPDAENWGGRATVFGSPWNYGSRLAIDEVARVCAEVLAGG